MITPVGLEAHNVRKYKLEAEHVRKYLKLTIV